MIFTHISFSSFKKNARLICFHIIFYMPFSHIVFLKDSFIFMQFLYVINLHVFFLHMQLKCLYSRIFILHISHVILFFLNTIALVGTYPLSDATHFNLNWHAPFHLEMQIQPFLTRENEQCEW